MLDERKLKLIDLLIEGKTTKVDIAKLLSVSRQTLYDWLDEPEVTAEVDRQLTAIKNQGEKKIASQLEPVLEELFKIALTSSDVRTKNNACQYLINRVLGSPTSNVNVAGEVDVPEKTSNVLDEFKAFVNGIDKGDKVEIEK